MDSRQNSSLALIIGLSAAVFILAVLAAVSFGAGSLSWAFICLVFASVAFATLLFTVSYTHAAVLCLAGAVAAAIFSRGVVAVAWSLIYIAVGWVMFSGVRAKIARTAITVRAAAFAGLISAALLAGVIVAEHGAISPTIIYDAADELITGFLEANQEILLAMYIPVDLSGDEEEQARRLELVKREYTMNLKMMTPMLFVFYALAAAYCSTALFRIIYNIFIGSKPGAFPLKRADWRLKLSAVSAVVIIISSMLILLLFDPHNPLPRIILTNVQYILAPGFCIMGIYFLYDKTYNIYNKNRLVKGGMAPAFILLGACTFAVLMFFQPAIAILVVFGLYAALIGDIKKFYRKTKKAVFGDEDDDEDI